MLEKIKPIDKKLQYQVEKLLKTAAMGPQQAGDRAADPMSFKPNPSALAKPEGEDEAYALLLLVPSDAQH